MKFCGLFFLLFLTLLSAAKADDGALKRLPDWLMGNWVATKVYEDDSRPFPEPDFEPIVRMTGQVMTVTATRLEFVGDTCTDFDVTLLQGTIPQLLFKGAGQTPQALHMKPRLGHGPYYQIECSRVLTHPNGRKSINHFDWWIVPVPGTHDRIEMLFLEGAYLELTRQGPVS